MTATTYTCARCNGSGRYSFNALHGSRCYGCNGTGLQKTKPRAPAPRWAVFGQHRTTGEWLRLYNVTAKTKDAAIQTAAAVYASASADFRATYGEPQRAMKWSDMSHVGALTWGEATAAKEAA